VAVTVVQAAWASPCNHVTGPAMQGVCRPAWSQHGTRRQRLDWVARWCDAGVVLVVLL